MCHLGCKDFHQLINFIKYGHILYPCNANFILIWKNKITLAWKSIFEIDLWHYWFYSQVIFVSTDQKTKLKICSVEILKNSLVIFFFLYNYECGNKLLQRSKKNLKIPAKEVILVHFRHTFCNSPINESLHWHFSNNLPFQNICFLEFFWMTASEAIYAASLKKNSNVNLFLTHICLHSWEFFIS